MGCFLVLIGLFFPRLVMIVLALTSTYLSRAFNNSILLPFLGFIFAPFTTLAYALAINENGSLSGFYLVIFIVGILLDLSSYGGGHSRWRRRRAEK